MLTEILDTASRATQNIFLRAEGMSWCPHCKNCWGVVQDKTIPYGEGLSMFPVCTECFPILSADQIIVYVNQLVDRWDEKYPDPSHAQIRVAAAASVRRMKASANA